MAIRDIVIYPADVLKKPTRNVEDINDEILQIIGDMWDTMYEKEGVGLACNQIGIDYSIVIVDTSVKEGVQPVRITLINPQIIASEGKQTYKEACLSVPGISAEVERAYWIKVKALTPKGQEEIFEFEGFPAVVLQHEIDHLNGKVYLERLKGLKKRLALDKYKKVLRQLERAKKKNS
ncbi:MAG TPA: peptide deformylase [Aquifex aeolicus]|uniref:Peptide deformylase n=1 Tax=Aquifex aeolicus TaxID=63363 RepID=A0A9D0YRP5_AQUAO|nr:peptide deformylase [Aquificales bacterium]HIP86372.1 peptide deformylase [Aquifex sp.]HIP98507.1 peptide deformylase [Aquifex aeolicus]HIQ26238.1 peptide deformylase [Aquifex aeolicus]